MSEILGQYLVDHPHGEARTCARARHVYPSPSVGSEPKGRSNASWLIGVVPVAVRISSIEVTLEGQSGAKISFTSAASSWVIASIYA